MKDTVQKNIMWLVVALLASAVLIAHAYLYLPFIADDALISLRYAQRFLRGLGLTWTEGTPVEGYSNLLWILLCSFLGYLGFDLVDASRLLGLFCNISVVGLLAFVGRNLPYKPFLTAIAPLGYVLAAPTAIWSIGGLEQPLHSLLLVIAILGGLSSLRFAEPAKFRFLSNEYVTGIALSILALTRPDALLFAVCIYIPWLWVHRNQPDFLQRSVPIIALPVLATLGQIAFRFFYYNELLPNTAFVKISPSLARVKEGFGYVTDGFFALSGLTVTASLLFLGGLILKKHSRQRMLVILFPFVTWAIYVALIGGDIFPGYRHMMPLIVIFSVAIVESLISLSAARTVLKMAFLASALSFTLMWFNQKNDPENLRAIEERWEWNGQVAGLFLKAAFKESEPLLAVDPAGCLPYFSELPSLDMLGLNDRTIARRVLSNFGKGMLGHEKGDGLYVLDRFPDIVVFCSPQGSASPCFLSGQEMIQDPRFTQYKLISFHGTVPYNFDFQYFIHEDSPKIGIVRNTVSIHIPSYFIDPGNAPPAVLENGTVVIPLENGRELNLLNFQLGVGRWTEKVNSSHPQSLQVKADYFDGKVNLKLKATESLVFIHSIEFLRQNDIQ